DKPAGKAADKAKPAPAKAEAKAEKTADKPAPKQTSAEKVHVMPAAQRLMDDHGIAVTEIRGSGPGGRVLKEDVQAYVEKKKQQASAPAEAEPEAQPAQGPRQTESVRMSPMRKKIAERLVEAQRTMALLTTFNE